MKERIRTCIATRRPMPDHHLLRVVLDPDNPTIVIPDPRRYLPGRGAWITPTLGAVEQADKRNAFRRALRASTAVDAGLLRAYLQKVEAADPTPTRKKTEH